MLKTMLETIGILIALSIVANIALTRQAHNKAAAFCGKEAVIGKSGVDLMAKAKKAQLHSHLSPSGLMWVAFMGGYRPVFCYATLTNGVITAKHVEIGD